ncbi:hypothetical protein H0H92_000490 [Tricholoma furcatifolium]|nr:hypothetical protein H0H92_000490 [Tricholoma furcatifolium]
MKLSTTFVAILSCVSFVCAAPAPASASGLAPSEQLTSRATIPSQVAAAWYPGWESSSFPPSKIPWSKYNIMTYSFAETTNDGNMISLASSSPSTIPQFVSLAKQNGVNALISVGGWSGSEYFSDLVAPAKRSQFVTVCKNLVTQYNLDGLDFDWEFPGQTGAGNQFSSSDSSNYFAFLSDLRTALGSDKLITMSVGTSPFLGSDGNPLSDVSSLAKDISYIAIMNYDIYGTFSSTTGPNAPLDLSCSSQANGNPSATSAVEAWTAANMPANQIVLGVPSYGHTFSASSSQALSGNTISLYSQFSGAGPNDGDYTFAQMVSAGLLTTSGAPASGIDYLFDSCSQTPFVYDKSSQVLVSYDNAQSFGDKGKFITSKGLKGFAMYDATGDYNNILLDAITATM